MTAEVKPDATVYDYARARVHRSRVAYIQSVCRGRRVLHVGCVDAGFYESHTAARKFLHDDLVACAAAVVGIDIDADGVRRMLDDGYAHIAVADITEPKSRSQVSALIELMGGLEVIVCGEVIEHVPNTLELMRALLDLSRRTGATVVITTPNPFYWGRFVNAARRREITHPDHNGYLSATNVRTLVRKAGGAAEVEFDFYENPSSVRLVALGQHAFCVLFPNLADGLIVRLKA